MALKSAAARSSRAGLQRRRKARPNIFNIAIVLQRLPRSRVIRVSRVLRVFIFACWIPTVALVQGVAGAAASDTAHYDGVDWHLKGEGVVCCPCAVPCPCRTNGVASYGHCEATLYLHIREGHYGEVSLNNLEVVDTSGPCGMSYVKLSAIYLDPRTSPEVQAALFKVLASFSPARTAVFPYVRIVPINAEIIGGHLFKISIPAIL
jgi:uncharacterized protein DUF1326